MDLPYFEQWTVDETCQYLQQEGLGRWEEKFREEELHGKRLRHFTARDLDDMGIVKPDDRHEILYCISKLWKPKCKVFNDPIHGHMELHPLLVRIIDTPQFQRLRHIKQLGGVCFVYPGASHNRFEHSIGVGYLAGQLVEALRKGQPELEINDRDVLCVQIAGLCHDLGHGPFSHLFDAKFIPKARPELNWKHENASLEMFDHLVKKNDLRPVMEQHGLVLDEDLIFIKEMIEGLPNPQAAEGQEAPWSAKGRTKDKSFLYEIVANKINGIDVDKFDYFARDCYHLGMQNNFDYHRFLKFARVCEVDEDHMRKHICSRDKEVANLYDLFHTRNCLHRRACQHKVVDIMQTMIAEAFLKADKYITLKGSGGRMFTLSTAIHDMEAYTKLTDNVFEEILNSSSEELAEAREILQKVVSHKHYRFLGETRAEKSTEIIQRWKGELVNAIPRQSGQDGRLTKNKFDVLISSPELAEARELLHRIISQTLYRTEESTERRKKMIHRWKEDLKKELAKIADQDGRLTPADVEELISSLELTKVREILHKIISQTFCKPEIPTEEMTDRWETKLHRRIPDGEVSLVTLDYGMKDKDPINNVYFYSKHNNTKAFKISKDQVSKLLPLCFSEKLIRVYSRTDVKSVQTAKRLFVEWCREKGFATPQDGEAAAQEEAGDQQ